MRPFPRFDTAIQLESCILIVQNTSTFGSRILFSLLWPRGQGNPCVDKYASVQCRLSRCGNDYINNLPVQYKLLYVVNITRYYYTLMVTYLSRCGERLRYVRSPIQSMCPNISRALTHSPIYLNFNSQSLGWNKSDLFLHRSS